MINTEKNLKFRKLFDSSTIVQIPVIYDALSALLAQRAGFELVAMGGNCTMASYMGYPDMGFATETDMVNRARLIAKKLHIPMYADADTGYGNVNNVRKTIEDYEDAGVSGVHLEDQIWPKKCPVITTVDVISEGEAVEKLKVAMKSRRDPNFVIIGRTDSISKYGFDEMVRRLKLFEEIGVDILMPAGVKDEETRRALPKLFPNTPMLADILYDWGDEPHYTDKDFQDMGYKFVSQPFTGCFLALQRLTDYFEYYRKNGEVEKFLDSVFPYEEYEKLLGIEDELNIMDTIS